MIFLQSVKKAFWNRFGHYPLFRRLRPRLMTMILTLLMPVSIVCLAVSVVSLFQSSRLVYESGKSAFSMYLDSVEKQYHMIGKDILDGFPAQAAAELGSLQQTTEGFGGSLYVSDNGGQVWRILGDGESEPVSAGLETLEKERTTYMWQAESGSWQALVTFPYNFALRNSPPWFWVGVLISGISILASPMLFNRLKFDILDPMETVDQAIEGLKKDLNYRIPPQSHMPSDEFLKLFREFNAMAEEVQASHNKEVRILETEMDNLRLQVNPHMLLNSYNMIYALAQSKNYEVIQDYTLCLTDYFRYVLREGRQLVSLRQELEFVDNYIRIQRIRFPGRFSYVYQTDGLCLDAQIPPLLIENFVENAVKYALNPSKAIEIVVSAYRERSSDGKDMLQITITDTGSGIRPEVLEKLKAGEPYVDEAGRKHIGIYNCMRRVELFYGDAGRADFSSAEGRGTQVSLLVPYTREKAGMNG